MSRETVWNGCPLNKELPCGFQVIYGFPDPGMICNLAQMWWNHNFEQFFVFSWVLFTLSDIKHLKERQVLEFKLGVDATGVISDMFDRFQPFVKLWTQSFCIANANGCSVSLRYLLCSQALSLAKSIPWQLHNTGQFAMEACDVAGFWVVEYARICINSRILESWSHSKLWDSNLGGGHFCFLRGEFYDLFVFVFPLLALLLFPLLLLQLLFCSCFLCHSSKFVLPPSVFPSSLQSKWFSLTP